MYIVEIEKANNFLKLQVCQEFESLHISDKIRHDFVDKIQSLENKPYFHRKLAHLDIAQPALGVTPLKSRTENREAHLDKKFVKEVRFAAETDKLISIFSFFD